MANQLRDTQDPKCADPYAYGWSARWYRRGFTTMLDQWHREQFPKSSLRKQALGTGLLTTMFAMTLFWMISLNKAQ